MFLFVVICLRLSEVSFLSIDSKAGALWEFRRFLSDAQRSEGVKWLFVHGSDTAVSRGYLIDVLSRVECANTVVGRIGCLPTEYADEFADFGVCHKYPILEAGFAFSRDLIAKFRECARAVDYAVGISFGGARFVDDFRFSFLPPQRERESLFLATFAPARASDLPPAFAHAAGVRVPLRLSPLFRADAILGANLTAFGRVTPVSALVSLHCLDADAPAQLLLPPPVAAPTHSVHIRCFDE